MKNQTFSAFSSLALIANNSCLVSPNSSLNFPSSSPPADFPLKTGFAFDCEEVVGTTSDAAD